MYKSLEKRKYDINDYCVLFTGNSCERFKYHAPIKMQNEIRKQLNKELYLYKKRHHNKSFYYSSIRNIENKYLEVLNDFRMAKEYTFKYW
tara:strand:+ start:853 stop:1122 length:270 start_codon:yes stop_codon:yes gene_type:complete